MFNCHCTCSLYSCNVICFITNSSCKPTSTVNWDSFKINREKSVLWFLRFESQFRIMMSVNVQFWVSYTLQKHWIFTPSDVCHLYFYNVWIIKYCFKIIVSCWFCHYQSVQTLNSHKHKWTSVTLNPSPLLDMKKILMLIIIQMKTSWQPTAPVHTTQTLMLIIQMKNIHLLLYDKIDQNIISGVQTHEIQRLPSWMSAVQQPENHQQKSRTFPMSKD